MNASLGFSGTVYGLGAGIFFIGYFLFEVPSNLILARVGARVWIARIAIVWGIVSIAMMFVRGPMSFYALRFLLGPRKRGSFRESSTTSRCGSPRASGRARSRSSRLPASPRALLAARFLVRSCRWAGSRTSKAGSGCSSSRACPRSSSAWSTLFYLTDRPEDARWLPDDEKAWLLQALRDDAATTAGPRSTRMRKGGEARFAIRRCGDSPSPCSSS